MSVLEEVDLPPVGWIIAYVANVSFHALVTEGLHPWLEQAGWLPHVTLMITKVTSNDEQRLELLGHRYQSNASLRIHVREESQYPLCVSLTQRWLMDRLDFEESFKKTVRIPPCDSSTLGPLVLVKGE